jgi:hypothetical protein
MKASDKLAKIRATVNEELLMEGSLNFIINDVINQIKKRTRLGRGVDESGNLENLKPLTQLTIAQRAGEIAFRKNKQTGGTFTLTNSKKTMFVIGKETKGRGKNRIGANTKLTFKTVTVQDKFKAPKLSPLTRPAKSNLTFSGQMLDAIQGIRRGSLFTFTFKESRSDGENNSAIARYAREKGRRFFDLSKSERIGLSRKISQVIKNKIKELFNS